MPRICNREGCGRRIVAKDGSADYRKHFCGSASLKIDKRERLQAKRTRLESRRCPHCGRKAVVGAVVDVRSEGSRSPGSS
jgi:DNA-directed RNA polymerase subunit RPC12/RpoP